MGIKAVSNIIIRELPALKGIVRAAIDKTTGKVLGTIAAEKRIESIYSRAKFPVSYVADERTYSTILKPHVYISGLEVIPEARGKGVASQLVFNMVKESEKWGCEGKVALTAGSAEKSPLPFYKKLGFMTQSKKLNAEIDEAIKTNTPMDKSKQAFMFLPQKAIERILKKFK